MKTSNDDNRKIFQHFIITQFNVYDGLSGLSDPIDQSWLKHRFRVFDKYCYPSVKGQSNQNFKWIVLFNINTPDSFKPRIKEYSEWGNFIPVYISPFKKEGVVKNYIQGMLPKYLKEKTKYLITSRLDSDDAICMDYIQMVQNYFDEQKLQFLNFTFGYVLNYDTYQIYLDRQPSNPFISLIEKLENDNFKTVITGEGHHLLHRVGPVKEFITKPAWIQGVHGRNGIRPRGILQPPKTIKNLGRSFKITMNLFLPYVIGAGYYFGKQTLDHTRKIRHSLGLTATQLKRIRKLLHLYVI